MTKSILITGATDGIGLETATMLAAQGHTLLLHGRSPDKLAALESQLSAAGGNGVTETYVADLSRLREVSSLVEAIRANHQSLDVIINNAGVYKTSSPITAEGFDVRFMVNTIAPYLLTKELLPLLGTGSRVVNLSSAAQAPVAPEAITGQIHLDNEFEAYAQSKLAITMWSRTMAEEAGTNGPMVVAVNPGSLLATKMVKEGFGVAGKDIRQGADILIRASLSDEFADASGKYFDNDSGQFAPPHADALDAAKCREVVTTVEGVLARA